MEVYLDGGVSTGTDIYKALALGARMVNNTVSNMFILENIFE